MGKNVWAFRGAIIGALIYEGLAKMKKRQEAFAAMVRLNLIRHHHQSVDPWRVISASMRYISCTIGHMITILIRM